jgi:hypothetical protein
VRAVTRHRRQRRLAIVFVIALLAGGCGERSSLTGVVGAGRGGGIGSGTVDTRLVGRWSNTFIFHGSDGFIHASRTTWTFGSDAAATRAVVASNLTLGLIDSVVTRALWRTDGSRVVLTYLPEGRGTARFDYFLQGNTLTLGGITFDRQ